MNYEKAKQLKDAISYSDIEKVRQIVEDGYDLNDIPDLEEECPFREYSMLDQAVVGEEPRIVEYLLDSGADFRLDEFHLLVHAAWNLEILELLVSRGAGSGGRVNINEVFIHTCADHGEFDKESLSKMVEIYLGLGAHVNYRDEGGNGYSALHYAVSCNDKDLADLLVNRFGAAGDLPGLQNSASSLDMALAKEKYADIAEIIIKSRINLNVRGILAPLHTAVQSLDGEVEYRIVELMLERGADTDMKDFRGYTALALKSLMFRKTPKYIPTMDLLLKYGSDPKVEVTYRGTTGPLMDIILRNEGEYIRPEIVQWFQQLADRRDDHD